MGRTLTHARSRVLSNGLLKCRSPVLKTQRSAATRLHGMTLFLVLALLLPWSIWRQMHAHAVTRSGLLKLPLVFAAIGVLSVGGGDRPSGTGTLVYLGVSALVSAALGAWRGSAISIWRDQAGAWISQGNRLTISLWVALIAIKFALGTVASVTGDLPAESTGEVFLFLGLSFAVQNVVVARRTIASRSRRAVTA
jgi:hypothetical protein